MASTRRNFLRVSAAAGLFLGLPKGATLAAETGASGAGGGKTLLILGGTSFLGPQLVEAGKASGYTITLFNRGKTNPGMFPDLEKLHGDRKDDLKALEGRKWDAVVDTSGYVPRHVSASATLLKDSVKRYVFISTISVFADTSKVGINEDSPVGKLEKETEEVTGGSYGPLKALCEQAAEKAMPGRVINIRPGLIVGPGDPTDRFTYWPVRVARGGEVLAPGSPSDPIQIIDVRDLAEWTIRMIDANGAGLYNATGPKGTLTIGDTLAASKKESASDATFTWVETKFLEEKKVEPWSDMPAWVPPVGEYAGFARVDCSRAIAKGLTFRPVGTTVKDTLAWWKTQPAERQGKLRAGIAPDREAEVLAAWRERSQPKAG